MFAYSYTFRRKLAAEITASVAGGFVSSNQPGFLEVATVSVGQLDASEFSTTDVFGLPAHFCLFVFARALWF